MDLDIRVCRALINLFGELKWYAAPQILIDVGINIFNRDYTLRCIDG